MKHPLVVNVGVAGALAAAVLAVAVGLWLVNRQTIARLHDAQVAACRRGNVLRAESNRRGSEHAVEATIDRQFMLAAAHTRAESGKPQDLAAARRYRRFAAELGRLRFKPVALVDCETAIP